jgi:hypothetical protein
MTLLEAISLEMERLDLNSANGINVCELIDQHNIECPGALFFEDFMNTWKENQ